MNLWNRVLGAIETVQGKHRFWQAGHRFEKATIEELQQRRLIEVQLRDKSLGDGDKVIHNGMYLYHQGWINFLDELIERKRRQR